MFIACNYLACTEEYRQRMEDLLVQRPRIIDYKPGFMGMKTLRPMRTMDHYLVVSQWEDQGAFEAWRYGEDFLRMHQQAFEDFEAYKEKGKDPPVKSSFRTYRLIGV